MGWRFDRSEIVGIVGKEGRCRGVGQIPLEGDWTSLTHRVRGRHLPPMVGCLRKMFVFGISVGVLWLGHGDAHRAALSVFPQSQCFV